MNNQVDFDIFDFLGIEITDNLAAVQKALNDLPARKMAKLRKNPAFSKMRSFIFTKTATPDYLEYVQNIRNLRIKNKPQTNTNQRQNQTDTNQPRPEDINILSDPDKQKEWIRQYDERVNELNRNRDNNSKDNSDEQRPIDQNSNEQIILQRLADLINQAPERKTSPLFTIVWFLNTKFICEFVIICFIMAILSSFFDAGVGAIALLVKFVFLLIFGYAVYRLVLPDVQSLKLIKNGYFTVGRKDSNGDILYTDKNNTQRRWRPKLFLLFNDNIYNEYLIVTDRNDSNHIKVLAVSNYQTSSPEIRFIIPEWFMFLDLPVTFDLSNSKFSTVSRFLWYLLALVIILCIVC